MKRLYLLIFLLVFAPLVSQTTQPETANDFLQQALQAYEHKDYASYVDDLKKAWNMGANHPTIVSRIAGGYARLGKLQECAEWLEVLAKAGQSLDLTADSDLASVIEAPKIKSVVERFRKNLVPTKNSKVAFTLSENNLIPEGVAYDAKEKRFLLGSINLRKIVSVREDGKATDFAAQNTGLWAVLGLSIDSRRQLWAAISAMDGMNGLIPAQKGRAGLVVFDLDSARVARRLLIPADHQQHVLGDVIVNSKGDAFTTDSLTPALYWAAHDADHLKKVLGTETFRSPQGLCFSPDERWVFVADYVRGILVIDTKTYKVARLAAPDSQTALNTVGIDGLYLYRNSLIATQNGVRPNRVLRIFLAGDPASPRIEKLTVLESNHPAFGEPTLGTIVDKAFYYVANNQLAKLLENPNAEIRPAIILKLPLGR